MSYKRVALPNGALIRLENCGIVFVNEHGQSTEHSEFAYLLNSHEDVKRAYRELEENEDDEAALLKGTDTV